MPIKIVLFGPESTGKSTLANELAEAFGTTWSTEYLRKFVDEKIERGIEDTAELVRESEVIKIAREQIKAEEETVNSNEQVVFLDTCIHTNLIYAKHYFGHVPKALQEMAKKARYDFFLLCDTDLPWQADLQRDSEQAQHALFKSMEKYLKDNQLPFCLVQGSGKVRKYNAIKHIIEYFPILLQLLNKNA